MNQVERQVYMDFEVRWSRDYMGLYGRWRPARTASAIGFSRTYILYRSGVA